jgi:hypothetical protein
MYASAIDFFPEGAAANATETRGPHHAGLLRAAVAQVWHTDSPTYTVKINGRLRKERVSDVGHAPPWVELLSFTQATAAADRLVSLPRRVDELQVVVSGFSGTGRVFVLVSAENIGGQR